MPITINGSGTVTGISAGGLPDDCITTADIAAGAVTQAKRSEQLTLDTAKASTSGTFIDFTGIPSWVKRVTVMFQGVSTNGTSLLLVRLGTSSGIAATGYVSTAGSYVNAAASTVSGGTTGFQLDAFTGVANTRHGQYSATLLTGNVWAFSGNTALSDTSSFIATCAGSVTLSGTLDRLRITTINGTDTFDAGSINIMYE